MRRALVVLTVLLGLATGARAQQVVARVGGELTAPAYTYLRVPITVDMAASGGQLLGSYTARLTWNPALLSYSGFSSPDSSAQGNFPPPTIRTDSTNQGILKFTAVSPSGAAGLVTIARFEFYGGYDTLPSPLGLSFTEMSAAGTFANLLPILTVQGASFCRSRGLWGDLDRDNASNSRDALIVLSKVVGLAVDPLLADTALADVDADGRATSRDALVILSYAVGMPVAGQRVLLPAASPSCATGSARQLVLQPGAIELVLGQTLRLLAQATDSAGRTVAVPPTSWRSSDYAVVGVDNEGVVTPRAAGTATITAEIGPGVSATAIVTVLARRSTWYVDIAATGRAVQNGSAALPFESPAQVFRLTAEGDTVRVAPGTYEWGSAIELPRGVLVLGGTPGDTLTRPVFRGLNSNDGLWLRGGQRIELRNLTFRGFDTALDLDGPRNLILEDVQFRDGQYGQDGIYMCTNVGLDTLRLDRALFLGNPASTNRGDAIYISGCSTLDVKVLVFRDSRIEGMNDAIDGYGVDSLQVLRSVIRNNSGNGISLSQEYDERPAVHIAHSRIERNRYGGVEVYQARRVVIDSSVIRSDSSDALNLYGDYNQSSAVIALRGDSIYMAAPFDYWLDVGNADSLVIQDVDVRFPDDTVTPTYSNLEATHTVVRRSRFMNVAGGGWEILRVFGNRVLADSVTMAGCAVAGCDGATGFHFNAQGAQPYARILRSSFTGMYSAVNAYGGAAPGAVLEVRGLVVDSIYDGIYSWQMDSVDVNANRITRAVYTPVQVWYGSPARPSRIAGNAITCSAGSSYTPSGIILYGSRAVVEQDTVTGCNRGVEVADARTGTRIRQSTLRNNTYGLALSNFDTVLVPIDSNSITGSSVAAVSTNYAKTSLTHNRIEGNAGNGLYVAGPLAYTMQVHDNAFVNNLGYALDAAVQVVDASNNWWGADAPPGTSPPNGVTGTQVTTTPYLSAPPANLPGLAPQPFVRAGLTVAPRVSAAAPVEQRRVQGESHQARQERLRQERREAKAVKESRRANRTTR